jgi:hypothetical protein
MSHFSKPLLWTLTFEALIIFIYNEKSFSFFSFPTFKKCEKQALARLSLLTYKLKEQILTQKNSSNIFLCVKAYVERQVYQSSSAMLCSDN